MKDFKEIAFLVLSGPNGKGGHHYSIRDLGAEFEAKGVIVHYITVSSDSSVHVEPLAKKKRLGEYVLTFNLLALLRFVRRQIKIDLVDAVISLDEIGVRICMAAFPCAHHKIIAIKPGWVNSSAWTAHSGKLVCFSQENYDYFKALPKYRKAHLEFVPQRVYPVEVNGEITTLLYKELCLGEYDKVVIAGGRVDLGDSDSPGKKPIFETGLALHAQLLKEGVRSFLILAGTPKNAAAEEWLKSLSARMPQVHVEMRPIYVDKLSSLVGLADYVIGMGRVAMEAMSLSKNVFIPTQNGELPVRITSDNFETIAHYNFTHRAVSNLSASLTSSRDDLDKLLSTPEYEHEQGAITKKLFDENLSIKTGVARYLEIIDSLAMLPKRKSYVVAAYSFIRIYMVMLSGTLLSFSKKWR